MQQQVQDHQVAFYEGDGYLTDTVSAFITPALAQGDAAIVVATADHLRDLEARLRAAEMDTTALRADGRLITVDASEALASFMVAGMPDTARFDDVLGGLIDTAATNGRCVRVHGEMVALLWSDGNVNAAIALEDLWNELAMTRTFSLLCAYPAETFGRDASTDAFRRMCELHTHVLPSESFAMLDDRDEELRAIALLQQQTTASRSERDALEAKQEELEAALDRLHEIDEMRNKLIAMVVHDIRSPAVVVRGYLNLLAETWKELAPQQIDDFLATGIDNVRQIERLVDDMTTVSRLDSGTFPYVLAPFNLTALIHRVSNDLRTTTGRTIDTGNVAAQPRVLGDERRQVQVLTNLLTNAVKYSAAPGRITINLERKVGELVVSVTDEGPGMAPEDLEQLFRPFARLAQPIGRDVKGTGLGLFIVKKLVEGQGGTVSVRSTKGVGSTFSYSVPLAA